MTKTDYIPVTDVRFLMKNADLYQPKKLFLQAPDVLSDADMGRVRKIFPTATIILDNGVIEASNDRPVEADTLDFIAADIRADYVIPPDIPGSWEETLPLVEKFINTAARNHSDYRIAPIIHKGKGPTGSTGPSGFEPCLRYWAGVAGIESLWMVPRMYDRRYLLEMLPHRRVHLLGFSSSLREDIQLCMEFDEVESIDSMRPFSLGERGIPMDVTDLFGPAMLSWRTPYERLDMPEAGDKLVLNNIAYMQGVFHGATTRGR